MRNADRWAPTRFVRRKGRLVGSRDAAEVGTGSRLTTDLVAAFYGDNLPRYARGRLLDLGCGKVPLYGAYRELVTDNICVDWENTTHPNPFLDAECDISAALPFGDAAFDTIILSDVLEHIPTPDRLWSEMSRVLAPGGHLLMNVPFLYWLHEEPHDYYRYTEFALRRFVEASGLELVRLHRIGGTPEVLADLLAKHLVRVPVLGDPSASAVQVLAGLLVRTGFGRRLSKASARKLPLGYGLIAGKA